MTRPDPVESEIDSKRTSTAYLGGAIVIIAFSILTIGNASQWFDYVSGAIFLCIAGMLAYKGMQSVIKRRHSADKHAAQ